MQVDRQTRKMGRVVTESWSLPAEKDPGDYAFEIAHLKL